MKNHSRKLISCILFLILILKVTEATTYLYRNTGRDRECVTGLYKEGPLDMIYIGGSSVFVYWQPLKAWNDCGFTSYSYATNSLEADGRIFYLKEALKTHRPKMFVIEMRDFVKEFGPEIYEAGIRNASDSMDLFSLNRWKYVYSYMKNRMISEETDILSYFFDIAKYHSNTENLAKPVAWQYIDNRTKCAGKGWNWIDMWGYVQQPQYKTDERIELDEKVQSILIELLDFCASQKIEVLFVVAPYAEINQETAAKYNAMGDIIDSYGYRFLNANDYYEEMKLDFSTDFYNNSHVNLFGAEKYTTFLESFLKTNYDLPNHKNEDDYESWNIEYEKFAQEEAEHKAKVNSLISNAYEGQKIASQIQATDDLLEWESLAQDFRFTIMISVKGEIPQTEKFAESELLKRWGFEVDNKNAIRVISDSSVVYSNAEDELIEHTGTFGVDKLPAEYSICSDGSISSIKVCGKDYSTNKDGINVVVVDNNFRCVIDSINISSSNKKLILTR